MGQNQPKIHDPDPEPPTFWQRISALRHRYRRVIAGVVIAILAAELIDIVVVVVGLAVSFWRLFH